jgi:hypothetical protein
VQLSQQLASDQRPKYKIAARYQFDSNLKQYTIFFRGAIAEYEEILESRPIDTVVRLIKFAREEQTAFLALIQMHEDLKLPINGHLSMRFLRPSTSISKD